MANIRETVEGSAKPGWITSEAETRLGMTPAEVFAIGYNTLMVKLFGRVPEPASAESSRLPVFELSDTAKKAKPAHMLSLGEKHLGLSQEEMYEMPYSELVQRVSPFLA